jgi:hypothetical protein
VRRDDAAHGLVLHVLVVRQQHGLRVVVERHRFVPVSVDPCHLTVTGMPVWSLAAVLEVPRNRRDQQFFREGPEAPTRERGDLLNDRVDVGDDPLDDDRRPDF